MKHIIYAVSTVILMIIVFATVITVSGRGERNTEMADNLATVMEQTVDNLMSNNKQYEITSYNDFVSDFLENLSVTLDTDSDITVNVLSADQVKGILSIEVIETYKHPNGEIGTVSCNKTVILESYEEDTKSTYQITYKVNGDVYKEYDIQQDKPLIEPKSPTIDGKTFQYWVNEEDSIKADISAMKADKAYTFIAVFTDN